ncbi:MAG: hypothetical protein OEY13_08500 [Gammaproteobacteria bacterium]|nr:hypothetical protein [Gammaproteobacteria bacterium]MDH4311365.1 hypothetical protein [Gammaproteobacteria bacterium]MDH5273102.1 hypothetical protein [Gammaproteobacteria bacterium]
MPSTPPYHAYGISVPRAALPGARFARATLLSGVTTIRNVGAFGYSDVAQRDNFRQAVQEGIKLTMGTGTGVHRHRVTRPTSSP